MKKLLVAIILIFVFTTSSIAFFGRDRDKPFPPSPHLVTYGPFELGGVILSSSDTEVIYGGEPSEGVISLLYIREGLVFPTYLKERGDGAFNLKWKGWPFTLYPQPGGEVIMVTKSW